MKVGLNVMGGNALFDGDVHKVLDVVARADELGVDLVTISDHLGFNAGAHAERRQTRKFPFVLEQPWYEPISFLSAVAARTQRIRLSTFVLIAPLRPPLLLAKQLATLDVISKGRVSIGLGVGWQEPEFKAAGVPFEGRFGHLVEMVQACRALWGEPPARFEGKHFAFEDFYSLPRPLQGANLPILFGFNPTDANLDRIARVADGWAVDPAYRLVFAEKAAALRERFEKAGRDLNTLEIHVGQAAIRNADGRIDTAATRSAVQTTIREGATTVVFGLTDICRSAGGVEEGLKALAGLKD